MQSVQTKKNFKDKKQIMDEYHQRQYDTPKRSTIAFVKFLNCAGGGIRQ